MSRNYAREVDSMFLTSWQFTVPLPGHCFESGKFNCFKSLEVQIASDFWIICWVWYSLSLACLDMEDQLPLCIWEGTFQSIIVVETGSPWYFVEVIYTSLPFNELQACRGFFQDYEIQESIRVTSEERSSIEQIWFSTLLESMQDHW